MSKFSKRKKKQDLPEPEPVQQVDILPEEADKPRVITQLVGSLGGALEGDVGEIGGLVASYGGDEPAVPKRKYRIFVALGVFVLIMAVIGTVATVRFSVQLVQDIANQRALKDEFTVMLFPVVIVDPPEFDSPESLQSMTIISASVWKIILTGETGHYEKNLGTMTIPAIDVEASARSIFGYGYDIIHQTIDDIQIVFEYYPETNSYVVPESPRYVTYTPEVTEITRVGELYTLKVSYMIPSPLSMVGVGYENEPVKEMIYTVSRSSGRSVINSIKRDTSYIGDYQG